MLVGAPRLFAASTGARGAGGLTMAIRVVEGHSRRAHRQQRLLQRGGGDVVGVEQAGAMARGSERDICRKEKGRGQRRGILKDSFPPPSLACARPGEALEEAEGAQSPE